MYRKLLTYYYIRTFKNWLIFKEIKKKKNSQTAGCKRRVQITENEIESVDLLTFIRKSELVVYSCNLTIQLCSGI